MQAWGTSELGQAWSTPPKHSAIDLAGRLPLVIGQPVFLVTNLATELGVANGSGGILLDIKYDVRKRRRYLINATVGMPSYPVPDGSHRLVVFPAKKGVTYANGRDSLQKVYEARRAQLPIVGGRARTAHNPYGRSLYAAAVHLHSVVSLP